MKTAIATFSIALILGMNIGLANSDDLPPSYTLNKRQIIVKAATAYNIKPEQLLKVAACESSMNEKALGDKGKAKGILQFHQETFDRYSKELKIENPDIWSTQQQAEVASYMWSKNQQKQWSCYSSLKKSGKL